jgi:putative ATP-dependent endonuclease of the OLD family
VKLVSVTVENFRSITAARKIQISALTTLVGPNNEGKSNLLRAIVIAMNALVTRRDAELYARLTSARLGVRGRRRNLSRYHWSSDCPLNLQGRGDRAGSKITLEFELSGEDVSEFYTVVGSKLNGTLPVSITFKESGFEVTIIKPGRGSKALNSKAPKIADFIAGKIDIQYIPAVRTAESAQEIVEDLVERELAKVEQDPKYQQALVDIASLQEPILDDLSRNITTTMKGFLPNISQAKVTIQARDRSFALRGLSVISLDDGAETVLEAKGDGVQSLAALALMRHASLSRHEGKEVLIALEEPESHLHPSAIRQLRLVLEELSTHYQVVLTTHNPIFTNRQDVQQNIIVTKNRAYPARTVKEVREILGVRLDDNLTSAEVVLIVEGREDKIAISSILRSMDPTLRANLHSGRLGIDILEGASNLAHRVRLHGDSICRVHALLDDDRAGKNAFEAAKRDGLVDVSSVNFTTVGGKSEAELEDLYTEATFLEIIKAETGLDWSAKGADDKKKWADRLRNLLRKAGKPYDDATVMSIKVRVAQAAARLGHSCLHPSKSGPIVSLANSLVAKLANAE